MNRRHFLKAAVGAGAVLAVGRAGQAAAQNGDQQRTVAVDRLNLRSGPGLGHDVVTVLSYGDIVSIAGGTQWADGYEWVEVAVWNTSLHGWVASEFLSGAGGSPFPPDSYVHVNVDRLNLRSGAGLGYGVVGTYAWGTNAWVTGNGVSADGYLWVPVGVTDGASGWFASEFLAAGFGDIPQDRVQVASGPLRVRAEPSLSGEVYFSAPEGAYGTIMDPEFVEADGYTWVYVQLDDSNVIGWMAMEFLNYIDVA
jgi:N-acetylmuramoyl-L-alanine amidase